MKPWIKFADAPGYTVVTLTTVFDSFGYCRIGNTLAARRPSSRISRLTTTDRTGRLMKISVKAIAGHPGRFEHGGAVTRPLPELLETRPLRVAPSCCSVSS